MKLFQFWDTETAPDEVEPLMATWANSSDVVYERYSTDMAAEYIEGRYDARTLAAFLACRVPAMQADFFRYCALHHEGGVYVDADTRRRGDLMEFLARGKRGILMQRRNRIANDFLFVRDAGNELFARFIQQAIQNIEGRIANDVWQVTGPGIPTGLYRSENERHLFSGFSILPIRQVKTVVQFQQEMDYKLGEADWRFGMDTNAQKSIFKDV